MYPAAGHDRGTLMNAVAFRCGRLASVGGPLRPGVVHRLDRDTSGLVVVALTDEAYYTLQQQFKARTITRNYLTLLYGRLKKSSGEIDAAIGRSRSDRKKMSTRTRTGKTAITRFAVLEEFAQASFVKARLATGRTHQIRVHFASIGHPVLGDRTYGGKTSLEVGKRIIRIPRQMLHAETLGFIHPVTGKEMLFAAPVPEDMMEILETLRSNR
jgi:23S rRNA pseudouridine1911/1915/1917 synthase